MAQILYGVGNSILREFTDASKIVALSKLKNVSVEGSSTSEKVYGGDSPYPLADFPKEKTITISAENATFSLNMLNATQGADVTTGKVTMEEVEEFLVPEDGEVKLQHTPLEGSVVVDGFDEAETTAGAGEYVVMSDTVEFDPDDTGKEVTIIYQWESEGTAQTLSVLKDTLAKPFRFTHRIPIHNEDTQIIAEGQLVIYKCRANNDFTFNLQPQTAFAPQVEFEALDPKRPDKKLWDFTVVPVKG